MIATATTPPTMIPVLAPDDDDSPMLAAAWSFGAGVTTLSPVVGFVEPFPVVVVAVVSVVVVVVVVRVVLAVVSVVYKMKSYFLHCIFLFIDSVLIDVAFITKAT